MPEGHVTHRLARGLNAAFGGRQVRVSSPQGRFAGAAALLDGREFHSAEAYGKNLFLGIGDAGLVHIHLGLIGKLALNGYRDLANPATLRLRIETDEHVAELRGPQTCALISPGERDAMIASLGPDPLRADADPERVWNRVSASRTPVAVLLMDQSVLAGVGNVYRAELLFRHGLDPMLPGRSLTRDRWDGMWADLVVLMREGVRTGRIDTVRPEHEPTAMARPPRVDRHGGETYVYRRAGSPCLVCRTPVRMTRLAARGLYWCPTCQA